MGLPLGRAITGRHDDAIGITEVDGVGEEFKDIFPGDEFHAVGTVVEGVDSEDGSSRDGPEGLRLDFVWESWGCYPAKHFDNCVVLLCRCVYCGKVCPLCSCRRGDVERVGKWGKRKKVGHEARWRA